MRKNILILSTSLRKNSNSDALAEAFARGAAEAGHHTSKCGLQGKTLGFCLGCLSCLKTKRCVIPDDVADIVQQMKRADVLVFATPIYYYEMCGQMKTLLDRANPLYADDYAFRDVYLLSAAAEDAAGVDARAVSGLEGWLECFEHASMQGSPDAYLQAAWMRPAPSTATPRCGKHTSWASKHSQKPAYRTAGISEQAGPHTPAFRRANKNTAPYKKEHFRYAVLYALHAA